MAVQYSSKSDLCTALSTGGYAVLVLSSKSILYLFLFSSVSVFYSILFYSVSYSFYALCSFLFNPVDASSPDEEVMSTFATFSLEYW